MVCFVFGASEVTIDVDAAASLLLNLAALTGMTS